MLVITRPQPEALALQQRLESLGFACLRQPLLEIRFLQDANLAAAAHPQAILATSANGVRALAHQREYPRRTAPLLAIGATTAHTAWAEGFAPVLRANGTAESLLALTNRHCRKSGAPLLHICGRHLSVDIAARLRAHGFAAHRLTLYEAVAATRLDADTLTALRGERAHGVLFYSKRTAQIWSDLLRAAGLEHACRAMTAYCLAPSAAEAAATLPFRAIHTAAHPHEDALLSLLPNHAADESLAENCNPR